MRFLFCCEFYYPSVGGVQEVMRQIAERLVRRGHRVTVATTQLKSGMVAEHNGVHIEHFAISGNDVRGLSGEVERYRDFVAHFPADAILIKAAQQWTFDALFPVLDRIRARKFFIPCGFSGLYEPSYASYFARLPEILRRFDGLIFYAGNYRDVDFCRAQGLTRLHFLPNGASEVEFQTVEPTPGFREKLGIRSGDFIFSTVGSRKGDVKGHREVAEAFIALDTGGHSATLVLNGAYPMAPITPLSPLTFGFWKAALAWLRREGMAGIRRRLSRSVSGSADPLAELARRAEADPLKRVLITDLPRADVIDLFKISDLFVFASHIEYSPLVLFEAAAAGTPFLSVPSGNAEEIAVLTEAGVICPAPRDKYGYTRVDPASLAGFMARLMRDPDRLAQLGQTGRRNWERTFTWDKIALRYEFLLTGQTNDKIAQVPRVSILLPVYNGGDLLEQSVRSILAQTLQDFELLVIDDGSTDGAAAKLAAIDDSRIKLLGSATRRGLAARLNEGIEAARGFYMARMDADDISFPQRLEKQAQFLDTHADIDLVGCRAIIFRDDQIIGLLPFAASHEAICARPWRSLPLPHPTWMGRAAWFQRFRYATPEVARAEDQELLLRSHEASRFACLDDILLAYRQGRFNLRKTLMARRHLFMAQQGYFLRRHQWRAAFLNFAVTGIKIIIDLLAALPGGSRLFFARMSEQAPRSAVAELKRARGLS